jgi:hypothetical protein
MIEEVGPPITIQYLLCGSPLLFGVEEGLK